MLKHACCITFVFLALSMAATQSATHCPGCPQEGPTFTEEINAAQVAVIARLVEPDAKADTATFEVVQVLKGAEHVKDVKQITVPYFGQKPVGTKFLILGAKASELSWKKPC